MKAKIVFVLAVMTIAVAGIVWLCISKPWSRPARQGYASQPEVQQVEKRTAKREKPPRRSAVKRGSSAQSRAADAMADADDEDDTRTPEEKKLQEAIEDALDKEDLATIRSLAAQALPVSNAEVRQAMVDALGWFGVKALPELTPFLADPDEDVRDSAMNEWAMAVSEIEDDAEKLGIVELAMNVLNDEDPLEDISNEYIGVDEKLAVESLLRVIEAGGSRNGIEKAKETYEFVTGETFTDRAAAEKWIAEEYEPPEKEQAGTTL